MKTSVRERLLTAEEYALTIDPPGSVTELVRGRVVTMLPPYTSHGHRGFTVGKQLEAFVTANGLGIITGEGGYLLSRNPDTVRAPDAAFLARERIPVDGLPGDRYFEGAPDLAVEVLSPDDGMTDALKKVRNYLDAGGLRVWLLDQRRQTVTVYRADRDERTYYMGDTLTSDDAGFSIEGFALAVADVFGAASPS